ncbi:GNVR domain-containing protein [Desulfoluna sp.]|uniref:GumC family protein n=1 Tax=Desulfoluna sp. TaxID=2045199 RepID=UPI00260CC57B|nr:GNVR domain-containing protein [Desulfoluna sp.]
MDGSKSGKADLEFYSGMIVKWYWVLFIPLSVAMLVGIYLVLFSQRYYESTTVILVQPQKLPEDVVKNVVAEDINTRVTTLAQRIQSRTNLEKIINEFHLFSADQSAEMYMEDMVAILRSRISVTITKGQNRNVESFTVSYKGTDPNRVAKITRTLATHIIDENMKLRETQVLGTNSFLEDEMESMRRKLVETETKLKEYRERYMGGLPEQLDSNLRILDSLNERLTHVRDDIRSSKYRLDNLLQRMNKPTDPGLGNEYTPDEVKTHLEQLREELSRRLKRYTKYHPDVLQLQATIEQLEQRETEIPNGETPVKKKTDTTLDRQHRGIMNEILTNEKEQQQLLGQITVYKKRVEDTPKREQELLSLQRDYDNIRQAYHSLLGRQLEAQIAVNMEKKQKGEQFRVIDPARVPQKPVEPDMNKLIAFVLVAGLGVGCGIIALLEFFFQTFRGTKSVESFTSLPVIATLPVIDFSGPVKGRFFKRVASVAGGVITVSLLCAFLGIAFIKG